MQRLEHAGERDRAAVRVRDDARRLDRLERAAAVHLGHDERVAVREPVGARLVDDERAALDRVRDELARGAVPTEKSDEVEAARGERLRRRLLDDESRRRAPCRPSARRRRRARCS